MRHVVQAMVEGGQVLAAQGRNGDDTLMHVNSQELQGLRAIARGNGQKDLTINPVTGLPEAFNWWGIVPAVGGAAATLLTANPAVGIGVGATLGATIAKKQGADVGEGAVLGGLSGYGAGSAATGFAGMAGSGASAAMAAPATDMAAAAGSSAFSDVAPAGLANAAGDYGTQLYSGAAPVQELVSRVPQEAFRAGEVMAQGPAASPLSWDNLQGGAKNFMDSPDKMGMLKGSSMTMTNTALPLYAGIAAAPQGTEATSTSGSDNGYRPKYKLVRDQYGMQRVVAAAQGGLIGMAEGGLTSISVPTTRARETMGRVAGGQQYPSALYNLLSNPNFQAPRPLAPRGPTFLPPSQQDMNAYLAQYQAQAAAMPTTNWNPNLAAAGAAATPAKAEPAPYNPYYSIPNVGWGGTGGPGSVGIGGDSTGIGTGNDASAAAAGAAAAAAAGIGANSATGPASPSAKGGLVHYAEGGLPGIGQYLRGPGDGMSDHIPAQVGGPGGRQIRVAANEYVVPADVVSHLGNGSSDAGARVLDKMGSKVRAARTGNPKQGKRINPRKFVPA